MGNGREYLAHFFHDREQVRVRSHLDGHEHRALAVEMHRRVVVLRTERYIGDVSEADDGPVNRLDSEVAEFFHRVQACCCGEIYGYHLSLRAAQSRDEVVGRERVPHVRGGQAVGGHPGRIEPCPQRELLLAEDLGRLNSLHCLQLRLHDPDEVIRDLVRGQVLAVEPHDHRADVLACRQADHRLLGLPGKLVQHRVDLGVDLGERLVRIVVQTQVRRDGAHALRARRGEIVDAVRLGDGVFERGRDEAGHELGIGPRIHGHDRDHRILGFRILAHRQQIDRPQAQDQDQEAHHGGKDGPAHEDVCKFHKSAFSFICPRVSVRHRSAAGLYCL